MKKTRTPRWRSRLNRGLIAIAAIALLCVVFVVAAGIYVNNMPPKMIKLAEEYYQTLDPAEEIPPRIYQAAQIMQWDDLTHATVRVYGKLESGIKDLPFSEDTRYDLFDQFQVEFKGGKWHIVSYRYSFQGRAEEYAKYAEKEGL